MQRCSIYNCANFARKGDCQSNSHILIGGQIVKNFVRWPRWGASHCEGVYNKGVKVDITLSHGKAVRGLEYAADKWEKHVPAIVEESHAVNQYSLGS